MSKLNSRPAPGSAVASGKMGYSENGNLQAVHQPEVHLYMLLTNSLYGNPTTYATDDKRVEQLREAITSCVATGSSDFVANVIVHARKVMNIRTMPIVAAVEFAAALRKQHVPFPELKYLVRDVIRRTDQITDMLSYALAVFGNKKYIPRAVLKGIGLAFHKFDEYQFAKYKGNGKSISLAVALRLTHPAKATEEQGQLFGRIISDTLAVPNTWEDKLSANGQLGNEKLSKRTIWEELLQSGQVGFMALMRNLRNICEAEVSESILESQVFAVLHNAQQVKKSGMLPYQFDRAIEAVSHVTAGHVQSQQAIKAAVEHSVANMPMLGKRVWIILDESSSMTFSVTDSRGKELPKAAYIASHFVAALMKSHTGVDNFHITAFASNARTLEPTPDRPLYDIQQEIYKNCAGGGTAIRTALNRKAALGFEPDTVILLSDMEVDNTQWTGDTNVTKMFAPDCLKIAINLATGNTSPVGEKKGWLQLAGWSDNIFNLLPAIREAGSIKAVLSHKFEGENVQPRTAFVPSNKKNEADPTLEKWDKVEYYIY